jgi:hypothetical protein
VVDGVVKKILILSANPKDTSKLRLDEEVREIEAGMERCKYREQFKIISKWAVRPDTLRQALLDHEPLIVHFCGHGAGTKGLALENKSGEMQLVSTNSLAGLFELFKGKIKCVVLNACYSEAQSEAIYQHVDCVMGMNQAIGDKAAIQFAKGFYDALGAGRSFEDGFAFGCNAIDLEDIPEACTPVIKSKHSSNQSILQNISQNILQNISQLVEADGGKEPDSERKLTLVESPELESPELKSPEVEIPDTQTTLTFTLENPEGQVPLDSPFYVERPPNEIDCYETILQPAALIRIKAPRQLGKTSLMTRILHHASQHGYKTVSLNFQSADAEFLSSLDQFLQWFCASVADKLNLPDKLNDGRFAYLRNVISK